MKRLLFVILAVFLATLMFAGGQKDSEKLSENEEEGVILTWQDSNATQETNTNVQRGGSVTVAKYSNLSTGLNPCKSNQSTVDFSTLHLVYETLVNVDDDGTVVPSLATSWDVQDSGITFDLRNDVYFSNGNQFNAKTAAWTINWIISDDCAHNTVHNDMPFITGAKVLDEFTFKITTTQIDASMLTTLTTLDGFMYDPVFVQQVGQDGMATQACGTGPFFVSDYMEGEYVNFSANPDYYLNGADGKALPYLNGVRVIIMTDDSVSFQNIQSGDIDIVEGYSGQETIKSSSKTEGIVTVSTGLTTDWWLGFNWNDTIAANNDFRKAVSYAIDKEIIATAIFKGLGTATNFHATKDRWFYSDHEPYGYSANIEKAREHLGISGYNGEEVELATISREPDNTMIVLVEQQLKAAGINVKVNSMERMAFIDKIITQKGGQIFMGKSIQVGLDPAYEIRDTYALIDYNKYCADLFELIDVLKQTTDKVERIKAYDDILTYYKDEIFYEFMVNLPQYAAYRTESIQGLRFMPDGFPELTKVWLKS